ncbi:Uncharacterised protein [Chlamydia trachomatis]|nr:Uncharacterised protein [Chlamydia trachomatis]
MIRVSPYFSSGDRTFGLLQACTLGKCSSTKTTFQVLAILCYFYLTIYLLFTFLRSPGWSQIQPVAQKSLKVSIFKFHSRIYRPVLPGLTLLRIYFKCFMYFLSKSHSNQVSKLSLSPSLPLSLPLFLCLSVCLCVCACTHECLFYR